MKANPFTLRLSSLITATLLLTTPWASAVFIAATDSAPFRRDQLPIDVETMKKLSRQLTTLCASLDKENPEQQRTAAQFLALAQSLDPVNQETADLLDLFTREQKPHRPNSSSLADAKTQAWQTQSWLASEESGRDGNALALCLGDVLAKVDPGNRSASAHKTERGKWSDWVAALDDFRKNSEPEIIEDNSIAENDGSHEEQANSNQEEEPSHEKEIKFARKTATITTPLWIYKEDTESYELKLTPINLNTWNDDNYDEFRYNVRGVDEDRMRPSLASINRSTVPWLKQKYHGLPRGGVIDLSTPAKDTYSIRRNADAISAAAAVLASASISGHEPTGIVLGIVQNDGKLTMPKNAWELIKTLSSAPPSRIVLPKSAAESLTTLLVMNDLEFFMKHDIFFADNIDELIAFSKKTPDAPIAASLANFASIRQKATNSIGPFVTNPFVRERLEAIVAATPNYASAQFLLLQASGKRPSQLSEKMLAQQIRAAMRPLSELARSYDTGEGYQLTSATIQSAHDLSRAALDPLDRLIASSGRELYGQALDLSNTARTLARAVKKLSDNDYEDFSRAFNDKSMNESRHSLTTGLPELERKIARVLGEPAQ